MRFVPHSFVLLHNTELRQRAARLERRECSRQTSAHSGAASSSVPQRGRQSFYKLSQAKPLPTGYPEKGDALLRACVSMHRHKQRGGFTLHKLHDASSKRRPACKSHDLLIGNLAGSHRTLEQRRPGGKSVLWDPPATHTHTHTPFFFLSKKAMRHYWTPAWGEGPCASWVAHKGQMRLPSLGAVVFPARRCMCPCHPAARFADFSVF